MTVFASVQHVILLSTYFFLSGNLVLYLALHYTVSKPAMDTFKIAQFTSSTIHAVLSTCLSLASQVSDGSWDVWKASRSMSFACAVSMGYFISDVFNSMCCVYFGVSTLQQEALNIAHHVCAVVSMFYSLTPFALSYSSSMLIWEASTIFYNSAVLVRVFVGECNLVRVCEHLFVVLFLSLRGVYGAVVCNEFLNRVIPMTQEPMLMRSCVGCPLRAPEWLPFLGVVCMCMMISLQWFWSGKLLGHLI